MGALDRLEIELGRLQYEALQWALIRAAGVVRKSVRLDGVVVPYYERPARNRRVGPSADAGDPVILVHGFGADKESWLMMAPFLNRGRRLLIPDLPGFGAATPVAPHRATSREQARVLRTWLDVLGVDRAHLVGNSMGGAISVRAAHDYPQRIASMTLICSAWKEVTQSELGRALEDGRNLLIPEAIDDLDGLLQLVAEKPPPAPRAMQRYAAYQRFARRDRLHALFESWNQGDSEEGLPQDIEHIAVPALVIHGDKDRVIHPDVGRALATHLPLSELVMLDGVGHVPQLEVPRTVARTIDGFLDRVA